MPDENIKDFTINWMIIGLLTFCLVSFTVLFMYNNNPTGLGDSADNKLADLSDDLGTKLGNTRDDSNVVLNITANTNPEASELGSRDSVSSAYKTSSTGTGFFESTTILLSWILTGEMGKMLLAVFGGMVGFASVYLIVKWIRNGV